MAVIIGLLFFNKYKRTTAIFFILFLCYVVICEFLATYTFYLDNKYLHFLKGTLLEKNFWWSTLYWKIGAILFFSFYYYKVLEFQKFRIILKYSFLIFLILALTKIILNWNDFFNRSFPLISVMGAIIIILCSIFYFIEILKSDKVLDFYKSLNFYISLAIFIWWLIITPLVFYDMYNSDKDWNFVILKWQIYLFANIFMYTTFTIGLIVSKPENSNND